ncbi:MAG: nitroreductase/quinone reductase family protein [Anaerolineae bacterium]|nr:nitroreductase/quinone reductase family protein [Anaerolineae bacterium]MDQ7035655.1 nitroreductase/quinone reductase family protein [Anaerolineae bacterium]
MAEKFLYLTTIGHKTGHPHTIEIWYVDYEDCYVLCAEHREKSDWVKNIQKDANITFSVAERDSTVQPQHGIADIISDESHIQALTMLFDAKYKWSAGLFIRICPKT